MSRWREWWKRANLEQFVSFAVVAIVSITVFSLVAYSTVYGNPDLPDESDFDFISLEADVLDDKVGEWFGTLFLAIGAVSLFAAALGHRRLRVAAGGRRRPRAATPRAARAGPRAACTS